MPAPARLYLVLYDIADPRRWRRVHRILRARGAWTQFSAFFCRLDPALCGVLESDLAAVIDPARDRVLIVDCGEAGRANRRLAVLGAATLPEPPEAVIL